MADSSRSRELRDAAWLALVPAGVALILGLLLAPRRATPDEVPLPAVDRAAIARIVRADDALAARARAEPLPGPVRALGSAIRDFHSLEAADADARSLGDARRAIDAARGPAVSAGADGLLRLRAVQLAAFVDEVGTFADSGLESEELKALAGTFVRSVRSDGWCEGHALAPPVPVLRVMFKQMWNALLGFGGGDGTANAPAVQALGLTLDEQRALYAFYLSHPHPSRAMREALASARRGAHDEKACRAIAEAEVAATELWRLEHIARLAGVDPTYPAGYARGVARFRRGELGAAADEFRRWLGDHPEGPLSLRAQNYLRAADEPNRLE